MRGEARDVFVRKAAGHGDDDARRDIVRGLERAQARARQPVDRGPSPDYRRARRRVDYWPLRDDVLLQLAAVIDSDRAGADRVYCDSRGLEAFS